MMAGRSLEDLAKEFDEVYTHLTQLQRRLISATRSGDESAASRELRDQAAAMTAAFRAAMHAIDLQRLPRRELEAEALRSRVLASPIDGHLLLAAARSQARQESFELMAEAIAMADGESFWSTLSVMDVLSAPSHIGQAKARWLVKDLELDADAVVDELDGEARGRLIDGLRNYAVHLPVEASGRAIRPRYPDDGAGAGPDVLRRWVDPLGAPTDALRQLAWEVAQRPGWPDDAVPTLEILVEFTHRQIMPLIVPGFDKILAADLGHPDLIDALRSEARAWNAEWRAADAGEEQELAGVRWWALDRDVIALQSLHKARALLSKAPEDWTGKPPLTFAREGARRCGEILGFIEDDGVADLLAGLPQMTSSGSTGERSAR